MGDGRERGTNGQEGRHRKGDRVGRAWGVNHHGEGVLPLVKYQKHASIDHK